MFKNPFPTPKCIYDILKSQAILHDNNLFLFKLLFAPNILQHFIDGGDLRALGDKVGRCAS